MKPLISAIVPIYNAEKYLNYCIESLIVQTEKNIEIILVNDGSTDNSLNIAYEYSQKDSRIKVINQENMGPSEARNKGINLSGGKYLSFIDADDWIDHDMYEKMLAHEKNDLVDIFFSNMRIIKRNQTFESKKLSVLKTNIFNRNEIINYLVPLALVFGNVNTMAPNLYRKELIINNNIRLDKEIRYGEDWLFNLDCLKYADRVIYIDDCYYNYRRDINSSSVRYHDRTFDTHGKKIYLLTKKLANYFGKDIYSGAPHFLNITIHCILSEYRRKDIGFKEKKNKIKTMLNDITLKEALKYADLKKFPFKHKIYALLINCNLYWVISWYFGIRKAFIN